MTRKAKILSALWVLSCIAIVLFGIKISNPSEALGQAAGPNKVIHIGHATTSTDHLTRTYDEGGIVSDISGHITASSTFLADSLATSSMPIYLHATTTGAAVAKSMASTTLPEVLLAADENITVNVELAASSTATLVHLQIETTNDLTIDSSTRWYALDGLVVGSFVSGGTGGLGQSRVTTAAASGTPQTWSPDYAVANQRKSIEVRGLVGAYMRLVVWTEIDNASITVEMVRQPRN